MTSILKVSNLRRIIILALYLTLTAHSAYAHSDLENLKESEIIEIQKKLVEQKLLTEGEFEYGKFDLATDKAYDESLIIKRLNLRIPEDKADKNDEPAPHKISFFERLVNEIVSGIRQFFSKTQ